MADIYPESRVEEILVAMINGEEYTKYPESRIEALLIELLGKIIEVEGRGAYEFKGSVDFDELPETLTPDMAGWTYNMAESFITDNRFVDGAGKVYPQGTNVSIANVGTDEDPDMMFDVPSAFVDVSAIYASINNVIANIAPDFSAESSYHENDLVIYNEILYIFTTDHAAGEFNPLEVEQTDISTLLTSVYNEIDLLDQAISSISESIPTNLSDLTEDSTHRTVTDTEKSEWTGKQSNVNLTLTQGAVVSDRDITDGSGNTLSVVADSVSSVKTVTGNPVVVDDALECNADSLVAQIVPIQDLHGYDHPWVGGAGKNKLPMTVSAIKAANTNGTWTGNVYTYNGSIYTIITDDAENVTEIDVTGTPTGDSFFTIYNGSIANNNYILNGCPSGGGDFQYYQTIIADGGSALKEYGDGTSVSISSTVWVYIQIKNRVTNNLKFKPMLRLSTVSDATFAPYSNICPISGRTAVNLGRTGKNVLPLVLTDIKTLNTAGTWNGNTYTVNGGTVEVLTDGDLITGFKVNGTFSADVEFKLRQITNNGEIIDDSFNGMTLVMNGAPSGSSLTTFFLSYFRYDATHNADDLGNGTSAFTVNISTSVNSVICIRVKSGVATNNKIFYPMLRDASVLNDTYEPYIAPVTLTIAFGQTVYGGTLDVKTGVLRITDELVTYDGSDDENWSEVVARNNNKNMLCPAISGLDIAATISDGYCNQYNVLTGVQTWNNTVGLGIDSNGMIRVYDLGYNTDGSLSAWKTHLAANPLQLCYTLATPTTVQLTANELEMLMGYNRVTSDSGDITLTYKANAVQDLQTEKADNADMVDFIENGNKASRAYTANQFMLWKGDLYKVTTSIASGATITAGTNVTKTTIGAVLTALLNA